MIQIFNSLSRRKEPLQPLTPGHISMYLCGDTVYDLCHMGHARSKIAFDVIRRYLSFTGLRVNFVRNITDIDDKIIRRAAERGQDIATFTRFYIDAMHRDYDALGILRPDHEPRATDYVPGMIELAARLIERGFAYVAADGDVMYSVRKFTGYGALSGEKLEDLCAGERVAIDSAKRDPLDFVLWKRAKPGEPCWESPWGAGRPGWHIECSVMAEQLLGSRFDIHGGGMDLKFPHHENEIAQSCAASGDSFARVWMHNGFLNRDDEKMAKSTGNFATIADTLKRVRHAEVIRYFIVSSHYRGPVNYSLEQLAQATAALDRIYTALREAGAPGVEGRAGAPGAEGQAVAVAVANCAPGAAPAAPPVPRTQFTERFCAAMDDDFNTPEAVAVLQAMTRELNVAGSAGRRGQAAQLAAELRVLGGVLGIAQLPAEQWARLPTPGAAVIASEADGEAADGAEGAGGGGGPAGSTPGGLAEADIDALIARRLEARSRRDFKEADRIRDELAAHGVLLEDRPGGRTDWRRA